jgi:bifunctional non-homologous end joining protein LigD
MKRQDAQARGGGRVGAAARVPTAPDALAVYRRKRDPTRTPEPFGGHPRAGPPRFVVHQHAARRLHYDLRLEMDGVLKSWAVPLGPSVKPAEKRLAVQVEDHPLAYADFEGVIPPGNYGAGAVIVWDTGTYRLGSPDDPLDQLARGRLEVEFFGHKMRGWWSLVRMARTERNWLLIKKAGPGSGDEELTARYPHSVRSGLTVEEMRDPARRLQAIAARLRAARAPRGDVCARTLGFMLATPAGRPFSRPGWIFEVKYDGVRVLADRRGDTVELLGRSGQVVTDRYPEIAEAVRWLPVTRVVLDGEIVAFDADGRPSFQRLQARMLLRRRADVAAALRTHPVAAVFFDCLALEGHDLRRLPLLERKACLRLVVPPLGVVRYGDHVVEHGEAFYDLVCEQRLEGMVAKRAASAYAPGRSADWVKIKCYRRQEFVVGGYTLPRGARRFFGALHLGLYDRDGRLIYVSKVGSGFDDAALARVWEALRPLARATSPFASGAPTGRSHRWVEPRLVCEVRFAEWTQEGGLRHPVFLGLRPDRKPEECRREEPTDASAAAATPAARGTGAKHGAGSTRGRAVPHAVPTAQGAATGEAGAAPGVPGPRPSVEPSAAQGRDAAAVAAPRVRVTNATKVFWPREGYTKGDLVAYYEMVAPLLLPYLKDRPVVLTRYPDGIDGKSFFQKDAPAFVPAWVRTERIYSTEAGREIRYVVVDDVDTLRYVANLGTIPLHVWASRIGSLDRPDWLVLDLDPKDAPFADCVAVARSLHRILADLDLPHYVKTSGGTGLHLLVPLGARYTYEEARTFARVLALLAVEAAPAIATVARPLGARGGRVYVDVGQNGHGRTIVAPFSLRPLPGAPVSCPLRWSEVTARLTPARFTLATVPGRFASLPDPLAPILREAIDLADALARLERRLGAPGGRRAAAR